MSYNMTNFTNSNNIYDLLVSVNQSSDNWIVYLFVLSAFVIMYIALSRNNPPAESLTAASASLTIFCLLLLLADLINVVWVIGSTLVFAMSVVGLYLTNKV